MRKIFGLALLGTVFAIAAFKGDDKPRVDMNVMSQIRTEGMQHSKVMQTLFELTDVNGPRLTNSAGMKSAERWAKARLESWGLQNAHIEPWGSFGKGWEINKSYVAMTAPYYQPLIAMPRAWTPGTNGPLKATVVVVHIDSIEDMAKYQGHLRDRIVLLAPPKMETSPNFKPDASRVNDSDLARMENEELSKDERDRLAGNKTMNTPKPVDTAHRHAVPVRPRGSLRKMIDSFLAHEGVLGVISGGRGTMGTLFTSNGASRAWNAPTVLPEVEMSYEHMARIVRLAKAGVDVSIEMDTRTTFNVADSIECNVVAEIPGTDLKDEYVLLGGHMDSWHAATGATDNGTGVAVCMEAVRILKALGIRPRRTIRVILWSGEEQGLLGSRGYVLNHYGNRLSMDIKPEQAKVSAYFNLDNGGGKIRGIYLQNNEALRPLFTAWLQPFTDLGAGTVTIRNTGSTDHISFDEIGIPGFQFIQDGLEYGTRTHHTNMDSYDRVVEDDLKQASVIMAAFVYNTAMMDGKIARKPLPKANPNAESWRR